jgi:prophage regulatory protein
METQKVITLKELCTSLSISRSMAYLKFNPASKHHDERFPHPIKLGARRIGFLRADRDNWLENLSKVA